MVSLAWAPLPSVTKCDGSESQDDEAHFTTLNAATIQALANKQTSSFGATQEWLEMLEIYASSESGSETWTSPQLLLNPTQSVKLRLLRQLATSLAQLGLTVTAPAGICRWVHMAVACMDRYLDSLWDCRSRVVTEPPMRTRHAQKHTFRWVDISHPWRERFMRESRACIVCVRVLT